MLDKMTKKINKRMSDIFYNDFYIIIKKQINYLHSRVFGKEPINFISEINFLLTLKQKKALLYQYNDNFKNYIVMKPLISIIMNCFNGERFLDRALNSIIKQKYSNFELIFWDNISTDGSKDILTISNKIGLNVDIQNNKRNKGKISFEYKDLDQLNKIIDIIKSNY